MILSLGSLSSSSLLLEPTKNRLSRQIFQQGKKKKKKKENAMAVVEGGRAAIRSTESTAIGSTESAAMRSTGSAATRSTAIGSTGSAESMAVGRRAPVLLFDVMDTIVRDPFYHHIPAFFGMSMKELLDVKHPTAWIEFEKGIITEEELNAKFFKDGRNFDFNGLKECVTSAYSYIDGVESILDHLKSEGYQMHAFTNYPIWYKMIEEKLKLTRYLEWTFVSCYTGRRKPEPEAYLEAVGQLGLRPSECVFIDDRKVNVEAASQTGMTGIVFEDASKLEHELVSLGLISKVDMPERNSEKCTIII